MDFKVKLSLQIWDMLSASITLENLESEGHVQKMQVGVGHVLVGRMQIGGRCLSVYFQNFPSPVRLSSCKGCCWRYRGTSFNSIFRMV